jgi:hypothetical protein
VFLRELSARSEWLAHDRWVAEPGEDHDLCESGNRRRIRSYSDSLPFIALSPAMASIAAGRGAGRGGAVGRGVATEEGLPLSRRSGAATSAAAVGARRLSHRSSMARRSATLSGLPL